MVVAGRLEGGDCQAIKRTQQIGEAIVLSSSSARTSRALFNLNCPS